MSDMKCPFCQQEIKIAGEHTTIMSCFNGDCKGSGLYGEKAFWQELIRTRKALDDALDKLDTVRQYYRGTAVILPDDIAEYCDKAIDRIQQITETKE